MSAGARRCLRCGKEVGAAFVCPHCGGPAEDVDVESEQMLRIAPRPSQAPVVVIAPGMELARRYGVLKQLGEGGMGAVFLARDKELDRDVALKVVRNDRAKADSIERFKREIQLSSKVTHKNVLRVFDLGDHEGRKFLTMQYVDGETLAQRIERERPMAVSKVLALARQIAAGLGAAHAVGVIHRDLKPSNILIDSSNVAYVTDFGLAKSVMSASRLTEAGEVMGSPSYMAPEQVRGADLDPRADVYALGILMYQMLTGDVPFVGATPFVVMSQRLTSDPKPLQEALPSIAPAVAAVVHRCLQRDKSLRYASGYEVAAALDAAGAELTRAELAAASAPGRRFWYIALAVGLVLVAIIVAGLARR